MMESPSKVCLFGGATFSLHQRESDRSAGEFQHSFVHLQRPVPSALPVLAFLAERTHRPNCLCRRGATYPAQWPARSGLL